MTMMMMMMMMMMMTTTTTTMMIMKVQGWGMYTFPLNQVEESIKKDD